MFFNYLIHVSVKGLKNLLCRRIGFLRDFIHIWGKKVLATASGEIPKNIFDLDERYGYYRMQLNK